MAASWFSDEAIVVVSLAGHSARYRLNQTPGASFSFSSEPTPPVSSTPSSSSSLSSATEHLAVFFLLFFPPGIVSPKTGARLCNRCQELSTHTTDGVVGDAVVHGAVVDDEDGVAGSFSRCFAALVLSHL
eukprot:CAMPEP_0201171970 /NCGR_PEP_ID=MMETSP0851-20130426/90014_1 /ASSEMBLY_ACC=CAM_ASM_000631 /TAXON_ID=183588 /ORGANISM="Pseudo-nitzschia fraudulenta, Strain WWA7" /LENGTH=129 /DNA_ID=CAMNT_0047454385 /DNA_START=716 /DNA_END=1105 /DNA_ORIENTATION=+